MKGKLGIMMYSFLCSTIWAFGALTGVYLEKKNAVQRELVHKCMALNNMSLDEMSSEYQKYLNELKSMQ